MPDSTPAPQPPVRKRCTIYIGAFNWYYGIFKNRAEWKWLNVQSLFEALRPDDEVMCRLLPLDEIPRHVLPQIVILPDGSAVERPPLA